MNRRSLLGRFSSPLSLRTAADRPEHHRVHLEPLEERKVLATATYVDDTWVEKAGESTDNGTLTFGELVTNAQGQTAAYGQSAFGKVSDATSPVTPFNHFLTIAIDGTTIDTLYISSAISETANGDTCSIFPGTYTESDIVINKKITLAGSGRAGGTDTLIVPEAVSLHGASQELDFPDDTHQGIIIYAESVVVTNLRLNGSGNGSLTGVMHYHQGITTLYEAQNGPGGGAHNYVSLRSGNLPVVILGQRFNLDVNNDPTIPTNRGEPHLLIDNVTVENSWYHGISLAAPADAIYREKSGNTGEENKIFNAVVNTVGNSGNQGDNHVGVLLQNLQGYQLPDIGSMDDPPFITNGNFYTSTINNVGVGLLSRHYGTVAPSDATGRNNSDQSNITVNNPVMAAFRLIDCEGDTTIGLYNSKATFTTGNSAIGLHLIHSEGSYFNVSLGTAVGNGPKIGVQIEDTHRNDDNNEPLFGLTNFFGPGTAVSGSVGILSDNANTTFTPVGTDTRQVWAMIHSVRVTGFETGVKITQSNPSDERTEVGIDRANVNGNAIGFQIGPNHANGSVLIVGQFNTTDPVVDPNSTILAHFIAADEFIDFATSQENPPLTDVNSDITDFDSVGGTTITTTSAISWTTGQAVHFRHGSADGDRLPALVINPGPDEVVTPDIVENHKYWINVVDSTHMTVHDSLAAAMANTGAIDFNDEGVGTSIIETSPKDITGEVVTGPRPDHVRTGNLTLGTDGRYLALLNGQVATAAATLVLEDFTSAISWTNGADFEEINPWNLPFENPARLGEWAAGNALQNGDGYLHLLTASEVGAVINQSAASALDATPYGYAQIVGKRHGSLSPQAPNMLFAIVDEDGTSDLYFVPTSAFTTSGYSTVLINLIGNPIEFTAGDGRLNWSRITGWAVAGDFGFLDGVQNTFLDLDFAEISFVKGPDASVFDVTGTVSISGMELTPTTGKLYTATSGPWTVVSNDGTDAVTGTFVDLAGNSLAEGATLSAMPGGNHFTISYVGGSNTNDVVLTQVSGNAVPAVDLDGGGGVNWASTWTNSGAVNITDSTGADATDTDDVTLNGLTATLSSVHTGDVLDVLDSLLTGTGITEAYDTGTGVLTLSGQSLKANYQTLLRAIKYNNTTGQPPVNTKTVDIKVNDGANDSTVRVATITVNQAPVVDLDGGAPVNFASTWTNAGAVNITDSGGATLTDPDTGAMITGMTAVITSGIDGDNVLAATATGNITPSFSGNTLTLAGTDTPANYQTVLRSITYDNTATPPTGPVLVDISASDGIASSTVRVATITISVASPSTVANRQIFYNNSVFDGASDAISFTADAAAIATDKVALMPGTQAGITNITSFNKGINGIIIDLTANANHSSINANTLANDFTFRMSGIGTLANNTAGSWTSAPTPSAISVSMGGG